MNKKEIKTRTKALYKSVEDVFKNTSTLNLALYENLFDDNFIKILVLLMEYFKLKRIPKPVLEICMDCDEIDDEVYNSFYSHCQELWLKKANQEIKYAIKEIEHMKD